MQEFHDKTRPQGNGVNFKKLVAIVCAAMKDVLIYTPMITFWFFVVMATSGTASYQQFLSALNKDASNVLAFVAGAMIFAICISLSKCFGFESELGEKSEKNDEADELQLELDLKSMNQFTIN